MAPSYHPLPGLQHPKQKEKTQVANANFNEPVNKLICQIVDCKQVIPVQFSPQFNSPLISLCKIKTGPFPIKLFITFHIKYCLI